MHKVPPIVPRKKPSLAAKKVSQTATNPLPTPSPSPSPSPTPSPTPSQDDTIVLPMLKARPETAYTPITRTRQPPVPPVVAKAAPIALKLEDIMARRQRTDIHINGQLRSTKTVLERQYETQQSQQKQQKQQKRPPPRIPSKPKALHAAKTPPPPPVKPQSLSLRRAYTDPLRPGTNHHQHHHQQQLQQQTRSLTGPLATPSATQPAPLAHPTKQRTRGPRRRLPAALTA